MLQYWPNPEELTMYRLQGYDITMSGGTHSLFECTLDGLRHREDGPAHMCLVRESWLLAWCQYGKTHRIDGPAIIRPEGSLEWCQHGKHHRDDAPAVVHPYGVWWYQHGKIHREDGPAFVHSEGKMVWYQNDKTHREDGPAVIRKDGSLEWWLDGSKYQTRESWEHELEQRERGL